MQGVGRIYLDTNIFIAAFEGKTEISGKILALLSGATTAFGPKFVTSEMTLAELLVLPLRRNDRVHVTFYSNMFAPNPWLDVKPATREIFLRAADLRARVPSRKLPDAVHLATSILSNCTHLLTSDKGFGPQPTEHLPVATLYPDEPTLNALIERSSE